jgi:hypothetical protein
VTGDLPEGPPAAEPAERALTYLFIRRGVIEVVKAFPGAASAKAWRDERMPDALIAVVVGKQDPALHAQLLLPTEH